ncbi:tyrosine-type recombinase/integrase [Actinokineospora sp. 24-640]
MELPVEPSGVIVVLMGRQKAAERRRRGEVETLPSGSLRVRVYAGVDPVTGKRYYMTEVIPPGPKAQKLAEKKLTEFLSKVDQKRNPRTRATVKQLLVRYLELADLAETTRENYESLIRIHIDPLIGSKSIASVDGEMLDSFYKQLRTCREHCRGKKYISHRTKKPHECDDRCGAHKCAGLSVASIRKVQSVLSGAGADAVRWNWIGVNPFKQADVQKAAKPAPKPPTTEQAATIVSESWVDIDWGMLIWLAMVTGARRGELCALTWECVEFDAETLHISKSIAQRGGRTWEKVTKTHQDRRLALDPVTLELLRAYRTHRAKKAGVDKLPVDSRIFSHKADSSEWLKPDSVSQRYRRMCSRIGWEMHIHQLRHYSATELISAGVDVTTVGGRLGHSGGGTTTLRFYSGWRPEADKRASATVAAGLPQPPGLNVTGGFTPGERAGVENPTHPYQKIARDLRGAIDAGILTPGTLIPTVDHLAERYNVSFGTAQRAVKALKEVGLIGGKRGMRAVVLDPQNSEGTGSELAEVVGLDSRLKWR